MFPSSFKVCKGLLHLLLLIMLRFLTTPPIRHQQQSIGQIWLCLCGSKRGRTLTLTLTQEGERRQKKYRDVKEEGKNYQAHRKEKQSLDFCVFHSFT